MTHHRAKAIVVREAARKADLLPTPPIEEFAAKRSPKRFQRVPPQPAIP